MCTGPSAATLEQKQSAALEELTSGNTEAAVILLRECVAFIETNYGESSLEMAQALFTLALGLFRQDRYDAEHLNEIEVHALRALSIRQLLRGRIDPSVGITSGFLGSVYALKAEWAKAEEMFRLSLENAKALVGTCHINTAREQLNVANMILNSGGDAEEATELCRCAIKTYLRFYGAEDSLTKSAISLLTSVLSFNKSEDSVDDILRQILETQGTEAAPSQHSMR